MDSYIKNLQTFQNDTYKLNSVGVNAVSTNIITRYPEIFKNKIGCIPDVKISLKSKEGSTPIYKPPRPVPYALQQKVDAEIDLLIEEGIIEQTEFNQWGTPLVIVVY